MLDLFRLGHELTFEEPRFLWLVLVVALAIYGRLRGGRLAVLFPTESLVEEGLQLGRPWKSRLQSLPRVLTIAGFLTLILALARPVLRIEEPQEKEGIDLVLVIDVSSSMTATDLDDEGEQDRLDIVKAAARRFVDGRPEDRMGLIVFARYPDLVSPLTLDHEALDSFIHELRLVDEDGPEDATGIGAAVARACRLLENRESRTGVVVLLTDGEENMASLETPGEIAPLHAAQLAHDMGIRVHAIAAGKGRQLPDGSFQALDTTQIERMAEKTGGRLFRADAGAELKAVYDELSSLEQATLLETRFRVEERYLSFLVWGVLLITAARSLALTRYEVWP